MSKYILIMKKKDKISVGFNLYTKEQGEHKLEQYNKCGLMNMELISVEELSKLKQSM